MADFLHDWAADTIDELRQQRDTARREASDWKGLAWEFECALRELLRDKSERDTMGLYPGRREVHEANWKAAFDLFDGEPI